MSADDYTALCDGGMPRGQKRTYRMASEMPPRNSYMRMGERIIQQWMTPMYGSICGTPYTLAPRP